MKVPRGFLFSGVNSGVKARRRDLALIFSEVPCVAAGCFTVNKARAAPILEAAPRVPCEGAQAILVNSGNANALTGDAGVEDVRALKGQLAEALKISVDAVLTASTGVIGVRLPVQKIAAAFPQLVQQLRPEPEGAAEAIMTTDTRIKVFSRSFEVAGKEVTLSAIGKGSGMIHPQLATTLALLFTDCAVKPAALQHALERAMPKSFNSLTIDGDMSTNDTAYLLANGRAGNAPLTDRSKDFERFAAAVAEICEALAKEVAADGDGASKLIEVKVAGAPDQGAAQDIARAIAGSSLVKAAVFGADPNWGRVLATVGARAGAAGYRVDPHLALVKLQGVTVYDGKPVAHEAHALKSKMRAPTVEIEVDLRAGEVSAVSWGCDLSYDYVKINADYTSLLVNTPEGGVVKEDKLANYSPAFKTSLLVEALSYISRFAGGRCVIKYGGAAMVKDSLKKSFCDDVNLLRSVGLKPIVVHGGGAEISKTLEKLGGASEFIEGVRVTSASDLKVVEMVLSGSINSEIVTLLNHDGGHAVGLSGKDGALLRAKKLYMEGKDIGEVGEITSVNKGFLEVLLGQEYIPVISPVGIGDNGQTFNINADAVAAEVAVALGAKKLIYLTDVAGILRHGELLSELSVQDLAKLIEDGTLSGGMKVKAESVRRALQAGVERVHIIDGRTPHTLIGELFTDRGVGTLVTC